MITNCPNCSSAFSVADEAIGAGRYVRCSKCEHQWFQEPITSYDDNIIRDVVRQKINALIEEVKPIPKGSNLPVIIEQAKPSHEWIVPAILYTVLTLLVMIVFIIKSDAIMRNIPFSVSIYNAVGIYDNSGLEVGGVKLYRIKKSVSKDVMVAGKIINHSSKEKFIPNIRISMQDEQGYELRSVKLDYPGQKIPAGEEIKFHNRVYSVPTEAINVVVDIGNYTDFLVR